MKNYRSGGAQALDRALALLKAITGDDGNSPASHIAASIGLAPSTARRMIATLESHGLITRVVHGRYAGGPELKALAGAITPYRSLVAAARPFLHRLARQTGWAAHLGVYTDDMVTYLVKEGGSDLFTREGAELEAYCTGIGKALLSQLPAHRLEAYLPGPFIRLTAQTICEPDTLRNEVGRTSMRGYALDDREMSDAISCVAVPIPLGEGMLAAISLSGDAAIFPLHQAERIAGRLSGVASDIAARTIRSQPEMEQ